MCVVLRRATGALSLIHDTYLALDSTARPVASTRTGVRPMVSVRAARAWTIRPPLAALPRTAAARQMAMSGS
jgi:hypothetical protein